MKFRDLIKSLTLIVALTLNKTKIGKILIYFISLSRGFKKLKEVEEDIFKYLFQPLFYDKIQENTKKVTILKLLLLM